MPASIPQQSPSAMTPRQGSLKSLLAASIKVWGVSFCFATQAVFLWTAYRLFQFLRYGGSWDAQYSPTIDLLLACFFMLPHSFLLLPSVQRKLKTIVPSGLVGCVHCLATCLSLLVLIGWWTSSNHVLWNLTGTARTAVLAGFYGSWCMLLYSLYLTGFGYQTGIIPWWFWMRDQPLPRRTFRPQSLFLWTRHPVYLSFLGLIWFTPKMSFDHVILTIVWTFYIYLGSYLKDRRLEFYMGDEYRQYAKSVVGFPLIGFGPWGRW